MDYQQMQRQRLEKIAESKREETNEREKKEDAVNRERTAKREVKKEEEKKMEEQIVTVNEDEIRAEVYADIRAALKVLEEFPELVRLVGEQR